ncbi:Protein CLEC-53, partial [Aphelenchoides avenae]
EPNQSTGCLYVDTSTGQWHAGECNASKPFICKVPASCKSAPQKCEDGWKYNEKLNKCYKTLSGGFNWDSAYIACRDQGAHLPSIHNDAENIAFAGMSCQVVLVQQNEVLASPVQPGAKPEVARGYPMVILGLKNTGGAPWSEKKEYNFVWSDGSFFNYSQLPWHDDEAFDCVFYQTGEHGEKYQWVLMNCRAPASTATAVCQKSPKEA